MLKCILVVTLLCLAVPTNGIVECTSAMSATVVEASNCKEYYICTRNKLQRMICPPGQIFNQNVEKCNWSNMACGCKDRLKLKCPKPTGFFVKPKSNCQSYYVCRNGIGIEKKCPYDELFNDEIAKCDWKDLVHCYELDPLCPTSKGKHVVEGSGCTSYIICSKGKPRFEKCQKGTLFNERSGHCERKEIVDCKDHTTIRTTFVPTTKSVSTFSPVSTTGSTTSIATTQQVIETTETTDAPTNTANYTEANTNASEATNTSFDTFETTDTNFSTSENTVIDFDTSETTDSTRDASETTNSSIDASETTDVEVLETTNTNTDISQNESTNSTETTGTSITNSVPVEKTSDAQFISTTRNSTGTSDRTPSSTIQIQLTRVSSTTPNTHSTNPDVVPTSPSSVTAQRTTLSKLITQARTSTSMTDTIPLLTTVDPCETFGNPECLPDENECPKDTGLFPHPTNRRLFIHCDHRRPYVKKCPHTLIFDPKQEVCVWPDDMT